ncbi:MAG: aldo/keto reductase [Lachnospiraceae bacterium]|nr:aldo/keto reductase [Lachnospiraceae bacterium]
MMCSQKTGVGGIQKRPLGNSGIEITELGFGCASVWGKKFITDEEAIGLFEKAYELGIRYFDTGYSYGIAEERIGKILRESQIVDRNEIVISSKFGTKLVDGKYIHDWSPEWMRQSVETSLNRMGIAYLDLLMCHGPQVADMTEEFLSAMRKLKEDGLAKAIGINTFDTDVIEYVRDTKCFDFVMLDYNIMRQDREQLIEELNEAGIGVIAGAPLAESLYSNRVFKIRKLKDIWYLARALVNHRDKLAQKNNFKFLNQVQGATSTQLALKYVLDNKGVSTAVFGTTTMSHLVENVDAVNVTIPDEIKEKIKRQKKSR